MEYSHLDCQPGLHPTPGRLVQLWDARLAAVDVGAVPAAGFVVYEPELRVEPEQPPAVELLRKMVAEPVPERAPEKNGRNRVCVCGGVRAQ